MEKSKVYFSDMRALPGTNLQEKLEKYATLVKKDMTDEDVENVYVNALIPMKGLRYEVEELRRKYLSERITATGK